MSLAVLVIQQAGSRERGCSVTDDEYQLTVALNDIRGEGNTYAIWRIGVRVVDKAGMDLFQGRAQAATLGAPIKGFVEI